MRYNTRELLSIPALAIAAMAVSATNADAQCPGGCFGYPTPSQPAVRAFAPAVRYQPAMQAPIQTFVQAAPFVSAPQYVPMESYAPVQSLPQPQHFAAPMMAAPMMAAPIQQTFLDQTVNLPPMQVIDTPQYYPQTLGTTLPANLHFPQQSGVISQGQLIQPMPQNLMGEIVSPASESVDQATDPSSETEQDREEVQEGQIEGEIISPGNEPADKEMTPEKTAEQNSEDETSVQKMPETSAIKLSGHEDADSTDEAKAAMAKAAEMEAQKLEAEKAKALEMKAAEMKAAKEKAAKEELAAKRKAKKLKAEKEKAEALEMQAAKEMAAKQERAAKQKAEKLRAEKEKTDALEMKAPKKVKAKANPKVETIDEKINRLKNSLKRQIDRANQLSKRDLAQVLLQLEADNASEAEIAAAEKAAADALQKKTKAVHDRIQARIDQLKK